MDVAEFEAQRARLTGIAGRILGAGGGAEDVVQEAWLRLYGTAGTSRSDAEIDDPPAWLTTVVTRLCLDQLRRRRTRGEVELDQGSSLTSSAGSDLGRDLEADVVLAEQVGAAMQVVVESLAPAERAAFVLHDVFGYPFGEIGPILGRSETAVRQLASRGRRKVQGRPETVSERTVRANNTRVVEAFLDAAHGGELARLMTLLAPDVVMRADLVGQRTGADPVYDGSAAVAARFNGSKGALAASVDGDLGAAWFMAKEVKVAFAFHLSQGLISEIELIADPDVLVGMDVTRRRPPRRPRPGNRSRSET